MEQPAGQIWVGTLGDRVCVRVQGRATHLHARPLRDFARQMERRGYKHFELDLGSCTYMDSTFLGVLAGISMQLQKENLPRLTIYRISPRNLELFQTLGVDRFFVMASPGAQAAAQMSLLDAGANSGADWAGSIIEAHETLVEADDRNEPRFRDLLEFLREDLARSRPPAVPSSRGWKQ